MFPVLFEVSTFKIYSYGFFIALGYVASLILVVKLSKKNKIPPTRIVDLVFGFLISGFLGGRILYVLTRFDYFWDHPFEVLYIWQGGLVFFGGLIGATIFGTFYIRRHKLPMLPTLDISAIGICIGHAFGRIGCFAAGCCHGTYCDLPWAVEMSSVHVQENMRNVAIHPSQMYESLSLFLLGGSLLLVWKYRKFPGQVVMLYFLIYPIIRSFLEVFRGDSIRGFIIEGYVSTSQFISGFIFLGAVFGYRWAKSKHMQSKAA